LERRNAGWAKDSQAHLPKPWRPRTLDGRHWGRGTGDLAHWNGAGGGRWAGGRVGVGNGQRPSDHGWKPPNSPSTSMEATPPRSVTGGLMPGLGGCPTAVEVRWLHRMKQHCDSCPGPVPLSSATYLTCRRPRHRRHEAVFVGLLGHPERPRLSATALSIVTSIISRC